MNLYTMHVCRGHCDCLHLTLGSDSVATNDCESNKLIMSKYVNRMVEIHYGFKTDM